MDDKTPVIGIIGGTGLYNIEGIKIIDEVEVETPFGRPSDKYIVGLLNGVKVIFLSRHGRAHIFNPSELPYRANIYGFKKLGVKRCISVSAVGSMKEEIRPGDIVIVSQFIDRTYKRVKTFYDNGIAVHVTMAEPLCPEIHSCLVNTGRKLGLPLHQSGTYLCIEGPQFSTRAESELYRKWGIDVIGMTNVTEAKLAREAEICYATIALSTDYDCWHQSEEEVSVNLVVENLNKSLERAKKLIKSVITQIGNPQNCKCSYALDGAIITDKKFISKETKEKLSLLIGKYL